MRRLIAVTDLCSILGAAILAHQLRFGSLPHSSFAALLSFHGAITIGWLAVLGQYGLPATRPVDHLGHGVLAITAGSVSTLMAMFWGNDVYISRTWFALTWILAVVFFVLSREAWYVATGRRVAR